MAGVKLGGRWAGHCSLRRCEAAARLQREEVCLSRELRCFCLSAGASLSIDLGASLSQRGVARKRKLSLIHI
eukprot:954715-Pyramimonas_sp.AAC.1